MVGLTAKPWWDKQDFPWAKQLEDNSELIVDELRTMLQTQELFKGDGDDDGDCDDDFHNNYDDDRVIMMTRTMMMMMTILVLVTIIMLKDYLFLNIFIYH